MLMRKTPTLPFGVIKNKSQMIFAFSYQDGQNAFYRNDNGGLKELAASSPNKNDPNLTLKASEGYRGWYIPLADDKQNNFREYVSASPYIIRGNLYIPTFIQEKVSGKYEPVHTGEEDKRKQPIVHGRFDDRRRQMGRRP